MLFVCTGSTKLALYGLGSVRDQRLNQTFRRGNVKFLQPQESGDDWFNLFVLHQNRLRGNKLCHLVSLDNIVQSFFASFKCATV